MLLVGGYIYCYQKYLINQTLDLLNLIPKGGINRPNLDYPISRSILNLILISISHPTNMFDIIPTQSQSLVLSNGCSYSISINTINKPSTFVRSKAPGRKNRSRNRFMNFVSMIMAKYIEEFLLLVGGPIYCPQWDSIHNTPDIPNPTLELGTNVPIHPIQD